MNNKVYNQFSDNYFKLFKDNIEAFQKEALFKNIYNKIYVPFYPSFGIKKDENCDFLFYGQAINRWGTEDTNFDLYSNITDEKIMSSVINSNIFYPKDNHSPLDWVNILWDKKSVEQYFKDEDDFYDYYDNTCKPVCRSFFWNVIYGLVNDYYNFERSSWVWSKKIVWSNLYKIAPGGKNPNTSEKKCQEEISIKLVRAEIEELNPKFCIIMTNLSWWTPFNNEFRPFEYKIPEGLTEIEFWGKLNNTIIIVTKRPPFGNHEKHINQISGLINK